MYEYTAHPVSDRYRECLFEWLAAPAPLWNQINYRRRQLYFDEDGDVWDAEYTDLSDDYAPILGKATCQQLARKNSEAWDSHFHLPDRLELTFEAVGISVEPVSEADSSSECPACGSEDVSRDGDSFRCHDCAVDAHSDVAGAWNILQSEVGPMARPAALSAGRDRDAPANGAYWEWDGHDCTPATFGERVCSLDQTSVGKPARSQPG